LTNLPIDLNAKSEKFGIDELDVLMKRIGGNHILRAHRQVKNKVWESETGFDRWFIITLDGTKNVEESIGIFRNSKYIETTTPEYIAYSATVPNDTYYDYNWGHNNTAQLPHYESGSGHTGTGVGAIGFDSDAELAWAESQSFGSASVIIAIIDSGVDASHPDLRLTDGIDFCNLDSNPNDDNGHGTACSGISAAIANNNTGVAGIAGGCTVMPIKSANSNGNSSFTAIENSVTYAADWGAHVISMSFGARVAYGDTNTQAAEQALYYAYTEGVVLFAAAGNDNLSSISWPANVPCVICVGAASPTGQRKSPTSSDGETWWGSNWGTNAQDAAGAVDIMGPTILPTTDIVGSAGYSTGSYYMWFNGTSCATPYVAGVAALLLSRDINLTPDEIKDALTDTATDMTFDGGTGWDRFTGYGLVNARRSLYLFELVAPSDLEAEAVSPDEIHLNWVNNNIANNATHNKIERKLSSSGSWSEIESLFDDVSYWEDDGSTNHPVPSSTYYYRIRAYNSNTGMYSAYSNVASASTPAMPSVPNAPSNLEANAVTSTSIALVWQDNSNNEEGFKIYRWLVPEYDFINIATLNPNVTAYQDNTVISGTYYYYRVYSYNYAGDSGSNEVYTITNYLVPAAPTGLFVIAQSENQIYLTWSDNSTDEQGFKIERKVGSTGEWSEIIRIGSNSVNYTNSGLSPNTNYYYRIKAYNENGNSYYTNIANATTFSSPSVPIAPDNLNATALTNRIVELTWNDNSLNETSFEVERSIHQTGYWSLIAVLTANTDSFQDFNFDRSINYYYRIRAVNNTGSSSWSNEVNVTINNDYIPRNVIIAQTDSNVVLQWDCIDGPVKYNVYSSEYPNGVFNIDNTGIFSGNSWSKPINDTKQFYYVTSDPMFYSQNMVYVQGGTFNNSWNDITVSSFCMSKYETTQAEFMDVMGYNPASDNGNEDNYPVYHAGWFRAIEYCNRKSIIEDFEPCYSYLTYGTDPDLWPNDWNSSGSNAINIGCNWSADGYRIPTKAEWQFTASGGKFTHNYPYSGNNDIGLVAWYNYNSGYTSHMVGSKLGNELGIFDMSGNIWEVVWDFPRGSYGSYLVNPHGSAASSVPQLGGNYWSNESACEVFNTSYGVGASIDAGPGDGFRVCRVPVVEDIVQSPTASPSGGIYLSDQQVTITSPTGGANIYYSLDGSLPKVLYTGSIEISSSCILRIQAKKNGMTDSPIIQLSYTIQ